MDPAVLIVAFIVVALLARVLAGGFDGARVEQYVRERGWTLVRQSWDPFGPGWFGEEKSRIYEIEYRDEHGDLHRAHVKTSAWSGVYFTHDRVLERAPVPAAEADASPTELAAENARLRALLAALETAQEGPAGETNTLAEPDPLAEPEGPPDSARPPGARHFGGL